MGKAGGVQEFEHHYIFTVFRTSSGLAIRRYTNICPNLGMSSHV